MWSPSSGSGGGHTAADLGPQTCEGAGVERPLRAWEPAGGRKERGDRGPRGSPGRAGPPRAAGLRRPELCPAPWAPGRPHRYTWKRGRAGGAHRRSKAGPARGDPPSQRREPGGAHSSAPSRADSASGSSLRPERVVGAAAGLPELREGAGSRVPPVPKTRWWRLPRVMVVRRPARRALPPVDEGPGPWRATRWAVLVTRAVGHKHCRRLCTPAILPPPRRSPPRVWAPACLGDTRLAALSAGFCESQVAPGSTWRFSHMRGGGSHGVDGHRVHVGPWPQGTVCLRLGGQV